MKKLLLACSLLVMSIHAHSQSKRFNTLSLEAGPALVVPLAPNDNISRAKYISASNFNLGARYMFTKSLGLKGSYQYNGFRAQGSKEEGINYHRLTLEAVYNLGRVFRLSPHFYETFGLLTHAGIGYARGMPVGESFSEQTGNFQIGFTPQVNISKKVAIYGDLTYVFNIKQHYAFDGALLNDEFEHVTGNFTTLGLGIILYIGEENRHADWF
ncbi:MAG: outer membrane beta-barrel protein [Flavobacteriaceae bacterium]